MHTRHVGSTWIHIIPPGRHHWQLPWYRDLYRGEEEIRVKRLEAGRYRLLYVSVGGESPEIEELLKSPQKDEPYNTHRNFDWKQDYDWEFMDRPPYSTDLAASDIHVF